MSEQIYDLTIQVGGEVEIDVVPASLLSGETEGYLVIESKNGRDIFASSLITKDIFAIISTSDKLRVRNLGTTVAKCVLNGQPV